MGLSAASPPPLPVRRRWLGSACSQHHSSLPHPAHGLLWEPPAALSGREAPAFQLSQGLGPWTCSADNGASATVRRGDLEVLDRAPFLGLDTEEVPPASASMG